jgi:hypothetical protein
MIHIPLDAGIGHALIAANWISAVFDKADKLSGDRIITPFVFGSIWTARSQESG